MGLVQADLHQQQPTTPLASFLKPLFVEPTGGGVCRPWDPIKVGRRSPADFMSRRHFQRTFYAWNNPELMRGLKAKGLQYDVRLDRPNGHHPERLKEGV